VEVVASLSQGRTAAAQCGLFTYKSVPVIFEPPCISSKSMKKILVTGRHEILITTSVKTMFCCRVSTSSP